ncbi:MAG: helix-turn-helix domain-containing protein [Candidatus Thermoplasmatota archaeon]|nr:helix-turn-helix domain-containing protein [Candidatus Thermoplasmatota archaeon]
MTFEIRIVSNTPLIGEDHIETAAKTFLYQIGYLSKGMDPKVPYTLFTDCFIKHPEKPWFVEELTMNLKVSKPTVYRHLNKLKSLDLLEEIQVFDKSKNKEKKAYRLRYGNLKKAWNFVEAHVKVAVENYGKTVDHIQHLVEKNQQE